MLHDLAYDKLPDDLKEIIQEADLCQRNMQTLRLRMGMGLRYHGLIPDNRIDIVRIEDGENFERLIDLKPKGFTNVKSEDNSAR